ncbi:basal-body rod modification protein FlgD [Acidocella aquatica]|uniref:Basal-body rod modification protein FlgD n=1 Tax=Acidocella aquatica TaxID=1922313 RepID=A0ABQ6A8A5_9PROT|nr:flagellar hook capping FlgD N-terminal domain-containing protein [Acidocella aquatica]GLR67530.1 basal-body rod modification protein FlgD [Acidocella aquatica]
MTNLAVSSSANAAATAASVAASTTATKVAAASSGSASSLTQANFLQLLTAQLKYQTPTTPANPTQMAQEFAAISTVNGINQVNTQLAAMKASTGAAQMAQASALVGKQVAVAGDTLSANAAGKAAGAFNLANAAQAVSVSVLNPSGTVAGTVNLGGLAAGQQSFSWANGTPGTQYTYSVNATDAAGNAVSATPYSVYTVEGVNVSSTSPTLNVQGSATTLPVSSVQTVLGVAS